MAMARVIWPNAFMLYSAALPDVAVEAKKVVFDYLPTLTNRRASRGDIGEPVALRWTTSPALGFPRQPFNVYRRSPGIPFEDLVGGSQQISGVRLIEWGRREMYGLRLQAIPGPGGTLMIEALDRREEVIPGQRIAVTDPATCLFKHPGIATIRATGTGTISTVQGIDQATFANDANWQMIEVVGLPFKANETAPSVYDAAASQGMVPASFDGLKAAEARLTILTMLHRSLPATGIADFPAPAWPSPDPSFYLDFLRNPTPSALGLIRECLSNTDDGDPFKMQASYRSRVALSGIRQADLPDAAPGTDPTVMQLPVVGIILLSTSSDSHGATGLGYGTIDFPPQAQPPVPHEVVPPGTVLTSWEYMVATEFTLPFFGNIEIAALAQARPGPEAPMTLNASSFHTNRAPGCDLAGTESVQLKWNLSSQPQGYGVLASEKPFHSRVLNAARPTAGGFDPFIPLRPDSVDGDQPPGLTTFTDPVSPLPLSGTQTTRYLVAGLDVFGRWSGYRRATHIVSPPAVVQPGLHAATLLPDVASAAGHVVPSKLEIEFSWDWSDRSPDRVELYGRFVLPSASPVPTFSNGFALSPIGAPGPSLRVQFDAVGNPTIASGQTGSVIELDISPHSGDVRKYRVTIEGLTCDFTLLSDVAYAVCIRGAEKLRPTELSTVVGPRVAGASDPIPPAVPTLPIDLRWTALPDATGRARGVLTWPASPGAAGYVVWEATESALLQAVDSTRAGAPPGTPLLTRATELSNLMGASPTSQARSMQAFSRVNTELIRTNRLEIELPASSSTIYAYRVSSVSASNVESERSSSVALFAVPRRNVPGQPRLVLRRVAPTLDAPAGKIKVIALPGPGPQPVGYRVFRVRNHALLMDVGMKGPPKIEHDASGWAPFVFNTRSGPEVGLAIDNVVAESWYPYFYQLVALGAEHLANGECRGESTPSSVQSAFLPPVDPPSLSLVSAKAGNATNRVLAFRTNLPIKETALGIAAIEIFRTALAPDGRGIQRTRLLSIEPRLIAEGTPFAVLPAPTEAQLAAMPEISRGAADAAGVVEYSLRLRAEVTGGAIVVRDPPGRTAEVTFQEVGA